MRHKNIIWIIISFLDPHDLNKIVGWTFSIKFATEFQERLDWAAISNHTSLTEEFIHTFFHRLQDKCKKEYIEARIETKLSLENAWSIIIETHHVKEKVLRMLFTKNYQSAEQIIKHQKCSVSFLTFMIENQKGCYLVKSKQRQHYLIILIVANQSIDSAFIKKYCRRLDKKYIFSHQELQEDFLSKHKNYLAHYRGPKLRKLSTAFIAQHKSLLNWDELSEHYTLTKEFIIQHQDVLIMWKIFSRDDLSQDIFYFCLDQVSAGDKNSWFIISKYQSIDEHFIKKYKSRIYFGAAIHNENINETVISLFEEFLIYLRCDVESYRARVYSPAFITKHKKYINWKGMCLHQPLSRATIDEYVDYIDFSAISSNKCILYDEKQTATAEFLCAINGMRMFV